VLVPTVLKIDGFRFFFFSDEHEPSHIHIEKADCYARIEIMTLKVTDGYQCKGKDLKKILSLVKENQSMLQGAWNEYFNA
jgi:hypothetical protein